MATCHSCFKKVPEETPHCPFCGAALAQPTAEQKRTVFGYAPSPQQLQQMQQQAQQAKQQQPQQPQAAPAAAPPAAAAPQPQQPVVRQTTPHQQVEANQDAMAATMFAPSDAPAVQPPGPAQVVQPAKPDYTPDPSALMSPASLPSTTSSHGQVASTPAPAPAPTARPNEVPPTMAVPAAPPAAAPAPAADDPFAVPSSTAPAVGPADTAPQAAPPVHVTPGTVKPVRRVATVLYIIMLSVGIVLPALLAAIIAENRGMSEAAPIIPVPLLLHGIFSIILIAKAWGAIQDGQTAISPGKAVGMLFIPFFNFYWVFRAFGAYAGQYNAFIQRNGIDVPRLGGALFIVQAVMCVIPYVNFTIAPIFMIVTAIKFSGAINRLAAATKA